MPKWNIPMVNYLYIKEWAYFIYGSNDTAVYSIHMHNIRDLIDFAGLLLRSTHTKLQIYVVLFLL